MNIKKFIVCGLSHEDFSLEEREEAMKLRPQNEIEKLLEKKIINGYVNLSTCLRVEFYIEVKEDKNFDQEMLQKIFKTSKTYIKTGEEAIKYLFELVCGYYSVIKGEDQILAQIKTAFKKSLDENKSSKLINIIFNKSIELGKKFRNDSSISVNNLSLEGITVKLIKKIVGDSIQNKKIFVLGIGDLSKDILRILNKEGIKNIFITNRTYHKAEKIIEEYKNINNVDYRKKYDYLVQSDIIISATSAPHIVIEHDKFTKLMNRDKKYLMIDLAVPRDIDINLYKHDNIEIFNLDDVWKLYYENNTNREKILEDFYFLIENQLEKTLVSLSYYDGRKEEI